jgi:hypothetical protein
VFAGLRRHPILIGICLAIGIFEASFVLSTWDQDWEKAPCRTDGGSAITGQISPADAARLDATSLDAKQTGWRLLPPGRTCELYGSVEGSRTLLAAETYPRPSGYIGLLVLFLLPIPIWWVGRAALRLVGPGLARFDEAYRIRMAKRSKSSASRPR